MTIDDHLEAVDAARREDVRRLHDLIRDVAPELPIETSAGSLGYGPFRYRYESGREGDSHLITLTPCKGYLAMYVNSSADGEYVPERFAERLPKADIGRSCVRIKKLDDLDESVLRELVRTAVEIGGSGAV